MLRLRRGLTIANKSSDSNAYSIYRAVIQSFLTACVQFRRYVAKLSMNSTVNGSSGSWSCFDQLNSTAWKIGGTVAYCLTIIVSLAANSLIVMIVYKTPNLRKPINFFIANMASSDLLVPIFWIPFDLCYLHTNSFPIDGQLGQALCKLLPFLCCRFLYRFGSESDSDSSGSIWSRGVSTPFPTHQIQAVSFLHSHHMDSCRSFQFARLVHLRAR